jgi:hypothetical protein
MELAVEETAEDDAAAAVWFMERVCVQLKSNNAQAVIKQKINGSQAVVELLEDKSTLTVQRGEVTMVPPQEHDQVLVTGGAHAGVEGELVCIDGTDAIVKESNDNFLLVDFVNLAKIHMDGVLQLQNPPFNRSILLPQMDDAHDNVVGGNYYNMNIDEESTNADEYMSSNDDDDDDESSDEESDDDDDDDEEIEDEILEAFMRTFHTGNYDNTIDKALSSDRGVTFTTRATQASYDKPDNWRERNRIGLDKVKAQLQTCIDSMRHVTSFSLSLEHNDVDEYIIGNNEPIVWHEPILDRLWEELKAAIDQRKNEIVNLKIRGIQIENVEMKKERLAALFAIFLNGSVNNSSTIFYFDNANLCGEGIIYLSNLLEASLELRCFSLQHNRIDSMESARCLSRSICSHTRVNQLDLSHCNLGSSPEILMVILQSDVKHLNLNNNNIDSLGAIKISEYL